MVDRGQIDEWRVQLKDEPSSFARDLAHVLLYEFERLGAVEATNRRAFATAQAAIEALLATSAPPCIMCGDAALRRAAGRLKVAGTAASRETHSMLIAGTQGRSR